MSQETCALCLKRKNLKESHLIPKFVGKWLKDNGIGYLTSAVDGSKRVQDIAKIKLLCENCEQKFSKLENYFANRIFYPFHNDKVRQFDYDENLKSFILSMAWRCIQPIKGDFIKENPTLQVNSFIDNAEKEWREFLNGDSNLIDSYETHLLFLDYLQSIENMKVDPKFHWYLLHTTDFTIVYGDTMAYFYVKLPWMIFVISIEPKKLEGWEGTIVNKNGHIAMPQTVRAAGFAEFLQDRAKLALYSSAGPSDEVATKRMVKAIEKDPGKYLTSNIYESWIVERDNVRKKKMKNMPVSVIELVEVGILDGKPLENVLFYGISSKRYVLFEHDGIENKFKIHKFTSHGLAHLLDVDTKQWWHDILAMHYFPEDKQEILGKYDTKYSVSQMGITTPNVLKRFCNLRPFDKILVGAGCKTDDRGNVIIPILPHLDAKKRECIQYMPFTNYTTGKKYSDSADTVPYWKPLSETLDGYADHRETKSGGDVGLLHRLRMKIGKNLVKYVGKEVANLDVANILGVTDDVDNCAAYDNLEEKILDIRPRDSYKYGISRGNLIAIQKKIRSKDSQVKLQKGTIKRLQKAFSDVVSGSFRNDSRNDNRTIIEQEVIMK